ncbi:MAG: replication-associated recombination protein A [Ruminococcus sp.]|nr:replication-associated recombination protein A [Ruminococcus sp.]
MIPLAEKIRPQSIDDMVGQEHLIGQNKPLRRIIEKGQIPNMIFYGVSGTGKTTLANIIAKKSSMQIYHINATTSSLSDIKEVISQSDTLLGCNGILLYIDEIQYFNKKQQQSLLEYIENGKITLIASTTENPYFAIFNAILSRCTVFEFKQITPKEVEKSLVRAIDFLEKDMCTKILYTSDVLEYISKNCGGDVRKSLNALEMCVLSGEIYPDRVEVTLDIAKEFTQKSSMRYDKDGDNHYDILSAFQKSIRGSDVNASLHYLARLIEAKDIQSICRRLLVTASEDVGLAYPLAICIVKSCVDSALQLGFPEARIPLAQAVILLATSPKSNACETAIDLALKDVQSQNCGDIPRNLQNCHLDSDEVQLKGQNYLYPHDYPNHYVEQQYMPDNLVGKVYYSFGNTKFERSAKTYWDNIINN